MKQTISCKCNIDLIFILSLIFLNNNQFHFHIQDVFNVTPENAAGMPRNSTKICSTPVEEKTPELSFDISSIGKIC